MVTAARSSFQGAAPATARKPPGTANVMLVWGLLWLVFGTRIGTAFSQETDFTLSLTLLAPLAAAWAMGRFGPRIILPITVLALLPSIGWTQFLELWVRIPVAFALLGVFGGGTLAARRAPETWLPLVRCSRAWLVVPAVALLWVGRAEWPAAPFAPFLLLDPAGGMAAMLLACVVDWRALMAAALKPRARRLATALRFVLPVLLVASSAASASVNINGLSLSWGSAGSRLLLPVACLLALLAGGQRSPLWLAVLLPLLALEALRTMANLPALADLLKEHAKTLTWPDAMYALAGEACHAGSAALLAWALSALVARDGQHAGQRLWLALGGVVLLQFGALPVIGMLQFGSMRFYASSNAGWIVGAVGFVAALAAGARGLVAAPLLLATTATLAFAAAGRDLDSPAVLADAAAVAAVAAQCGADAAAVAAVAALCGFIGWCAHRSMVHTRKADSGSAGLLDISRLAAFVHRLDTSATLRSFGALLAVLGVAWMLFAMGAFAGIVHWLSGGEALDLDAEKVALIVAGMTLLLLTPLAFIVNDALQRRDGARPVSALSGAVLAALGLALVGALLGGFAVVPQELVGGEAASRVVVPATLAVILALLATVLVTSARRVAAVAAGLLMLLLLLLIALGALALLAMLSPERESEGNAVSTALIVLAAAVFIALLVRGVRLRADLAGDVPRGLLFGEIAGGSLWARLACLMGMPASMWRRAALLTPAFWAFLLARPLVYVGAFGLWQGQALLGLCAIVGGHAAFAGGKRLAAREIWRVDAVHGSPPVLFLRSFEDDQFELGRRSRNPVRRWLALWSFRRNLDEMLVDEVARYGSVVALGRPGETRVPFGAARHYATHDDWRRIITETARRAHAIVIVAGETPGVREEYDLIVREGLLDRTVLMFRPGAEAQAGNRAALAAFATAGGAVASRLDSGSAPLVALLRLGGEPVLLTAERPDAAAYVAVLRAHFQRRDAASLRRAVREAPAAWAERIQMAPPSV